MHLFLIRHGETEHNASGLLAGATDSRLTNHGILQAQRLGKHLAAARNLCLTHIYASDLQRAWMTADELRKGQASYLEDHTGLPAIVKLELLREQDFGSFELTPWTSKRLFDALDTRIPSATDPGFRHKETTESMKIRADQFLDDYVVPLWVVADDLQNQCVAVVSHGLFLTSLWKAIVSRFEARNIQLGPEVERSLVGRPLEYITAWTNTGYLEVEVTAIPSTSTASSILLEHSAIKSSKVSPPLSTLSLKVITINGSDHLLNLKRTRGGVGSAAHDTRQKQIDGFFKRPKRDDGSITD